MKVKFETWFRAVMILLLVTVFWTLLATAQTNTNAPPHPAAATNKVGFLMHEVRELDNSYLTFGLDGIAPLREKTLLGQPLWKYAASFVYIFLAFCVAKLIDLLTFVWLKKFAAKAKTRFAELLLEMLRGPIKIVAFALLLNIGLNVFDWPPTVKSYFSKALVLVVAASLTYVAIKVVDVLLDLWRARHTHESDQRFDDQLFSVLRKSLSAFIVIVGGLVTASNIGINITAAITSLSIGGLAVGLAAQDTLANLFGAVAVFADKPFRVGDTIKLDAIEGVVEAVGLRSTRVRNADGQIVTIPNKTIGAAAITNVSQRPNIKTTINLLLSRTLPAEKVKRALHLLDEIYRGNPMTQDAWISFNQFSGGHINILIVHWWKGTEYQKYLKGIQEMNLAVKERFDAEGITFALRN